MIVELIGPPGAGKTTLLPMVAAFFQELGLGAFSAVDAARPCARRTLPGAAVTHLSPQALHRPLLWQVFYRLSTMYRLKFIATHPQLTWRLARLQRQRPADADVRRRRVSHWFLHHVGTYEFFRTYARPDEVIIFDEGFAHRVVQLFSSSVEVPDAGQIATYLDGVPQPDLLVAVKASRETCEQRIYSRGVWDYLREKAPGEVSQFVANAHLAVNLALNQAREKGWRIVEVDNNTEDLLAARLDLQRQIALALPVGDTGIYLGAI
jgi:hypothetical protein